MTWTLFFEIPKSRNPWPGIQGPIKGNHMKQKEEQQALTESTQRSAEGGLKRAKAKVDGVTSLTSAGSGRGLRKKQGASVRYEPGMKRYGSS